MRLQWTRLSTCKRAISSFTSNLRRFNSTILRSSIDGCERASAISASKAWCRRSSSARCACMDMLGGSPQSDCYLTEEVYTILPHFRSGFRLCNATIPDLPGVSIARLEGERAKRDTFLKGFGVARFAVSDLGRVRGQLCIYCLPAMAVRDGLFIGRRAPKTTKAGDRRFGRWSAPAKRAT